MTAQTSVGGQITAATLAQSNFDNGEYATYTMTVKTINKVPSGAAFMISYTSDVDFASSATTCQVVTSGSVYSMTCVIERAARRIIMKGNFNTEVPAGS